MAFSNFAVIISVVIHFGLLLYAALRFRHRDVFAFCILFYLITFSIVSNLFFSIGTNMSERFMFMPSLGFTLAIAALFIKWTEGRQTMLVSSLAMTVIAIMYSVKTTARNPAWENGNTLISTDVKTSRNSAKIRTGYSFKLLEEAMSLQSKGDSAQPRIQQLTQQVLENTEASLAVYPTYSSTWLFRGLAFSFQKNFSAAVECLGQADHLRPNSGDIRTNLGVACREYGRILYNEKKWEEAANNLSRAFNYLPGDYETAAMAGIAYINLKNFDSAATYFEQYTK